MDQNDHFIRIRFIDSGIGIPDDKINDIFEVYYTMKEAGTDLDLTIAHQIVERYFGAIDVGRHPNRG
jgi:nitrogen fixation/metabolism regulation signal transduction histidine kinase